MTNDTRHPVAPVEDRYPPAFYVLFTEGHTLSHGSERLAIRKWASEPFYGALKYSIEDSVTKMNPEGHELAAKVWNERYVEAVKSSAKQADRYAEHLAALDDEIVALRSSLQHIRNIALKRLCDFQEVTIKEIELISRRALNGEKPNDQ